MIMGYYAIQLDLIVPGGCDYVFRRTKRERHDCHRWLASARGDHAGAIAHEQVGHIVGAVIPIDD